MNDRKGNPSDPAEEAERARKAYQNLADWQDRNAVFSGGVSMQYGAGKQYNVQIGQPEIAQKIVSRPLPPMEEVKALPESVTTSTGNFTNVDGPLSIPQSPINIVGTLPSEPKRSWFDWLFASIFGERT